MLGGAEKNFSDLSNEEQNTKLEQVAALLKENGLETIKPKILD